MHKDCIIWADSYDRPEVYRKLLADKGNSFFENIVRHLKSYHICKMIFILGPNAEGFKQFISANRDFFSFAFDFVETIEPVGTGGELMQALQYSDTPDVLLVDACNYLKPDIDKLFAWQEIKMGDVTLTLGEKTPMEGCLIPQLDPDNRIIDFSIGKGTDTGFADMGYYCLFRQSFTNIVFPRKFDFQQDYLLKYYRERDFLALVYEGEFLNLEKVE